MIPRGADEMRELDRGFFEMLLDNMSDGVYVLNREMRFIYVNAAYCSQLYLTKENREFLFIDR